MLNGNQPITPELLYQLMSQQTQTLANIGNTLGQLQKARDKAIRKSVRNLIPGQDFQSNFDVMTAYVDNSNNSNPITISADGVTWVIEASEQRWIYPMGGQAFTVDGSTPTGRVQAVLMDTFVPAAQNSIGQVSIGNVTVENTTSDPVPTTVTNTPNVQLTGRNVANGQSVSGPSYQLDASNYPALRIVDAAPYAYDATYDALKIDVKPVEEVVLFNQNITVSGTVYGSLEDVSRYKTFLLFATCTLDQAPSVQVLIADKKASKTWNGTAWGYPSTTLGTLTGEPFILNTYFTWLNNVGLKSIEMYVNLATAPTTGNLTIKLWGVPN